MNEISVLNAISATLSYDKVSLITRGKKTELKVEKEISGLRVGIFRC